MLHQLLMMTDGESALRCAKNLQRPETERIQSHTHQLMQKKKFGPVLNIEIATVVDIPGIEVQVPSLSSPGYSVWILINARGIDLKLASPSVSQIWFDTMTRMNEKQMERGIEMVHSQYRKGNSEINWRKSSRTRTGSIAFILEASRRGLKSVKMKMENLDLFVQSKVTQVE